MSLARTRFYQISAACCLLSTFAHAQASHDGVADIITAPGPGYVKISLITPAVQSARAAARRTQSLDAMDEMLRLYDGEISYVEGVAIDSFRLPKDEYFWTFEPDLLVSTREGTVVEVMLLGADDYGIYVEDVEGMVVFILL